MEENNKEETKKFNIKERWKDKRERAKIELMLYGIFFLAIIIFARISSSFSDSNIPKELDINLTSLGRFLVNRVYQEINDIISKVDQA